MEALNRSFSSSSSFGTKKQGDGENNGGVDCDDHVESELFLNVYDLTPMNNYIYWCGFGIFHSGIEVHGTEYGFGAHEYPLSGVFEVEPRSCPGFIYRRSVWLGSTKMSHSEIRDFIECLSVKYHGNTYHMIMKNCNHFTNDVCMHLTGKYIPGWVNRAARLGSFCNCLLSESIQVTAVGHQPEILTLSDGSESLASDDGETDDEDVCRQLLTTSNNDAMLPGVEHTGPAVELT